MKFRLVYFREIWHSLHTNVLVAILSRVTGFCPLRTNVLVVILSAVTGFCPRIMHQEKLIISCYLKYVLKTPESKIPVNTTNFPLSIRNKLLLYV